MTSSTLVLCWLLAITSLALGDGPFLGDLPASDIESWYEANFGVAIESVYDSIFTSNVSLKTHEQAKELKENFEKIEQYNITHSLPAAKTLYQAEKMMENNDIEEDIEVLDILKNIINKSSVFARNLINGYACHGVEPIRSSGSDKEIEHEQDNEFIVFYNPGDPESISTSQVLPREDGDKMMITTERHYNGINLKYYILVDNGDYPDNIRMLGNILSKKVIVSEQATKEKICTVDPKPKAIVCMPMSKLFNWTLEDAAKNHEARFKSLEKFIQYCK